MHLVGILIQGKRCSPRPVLDLARPFPPRENRAREEVILAALKSKGRKPHNLSRWHAPLEAKRAQWNCLRRIRDLGFLAQHQEKLQGKCDFAVEFGENDSHCSVNFGWGPDAKSPLRRA